MPDDFTRQLIVRRSRALGLDPDAVIAVARGEGGLYNRPNDIGDLAGGGSYGPFQLYAKGALPAQFRGKPKAADAWAWSPAGINYALGRIASVARGLRGPEAVEAIVRRFERPADPTTSVSNAVARLGQVPYQGPTAPAPTPGAPPRNFNPRAKFKLRDTPQPAVNSLAASVLASNAAIIGVPALDPAIFAEAATTPQAQPPQLRPPVSRKTKELPGLGPKVPGKPVAKRILATAHSQVGRPYVWGGESRAEGGFDCSGLIYAAYLAQGIKIPRTTYEQVKVGKPVKWGQFRPGDLIFTNGGGHVVMYAGGGKVIAARKRGTLIQYQPLEGFRSSFYTARRYL